MPWNTYCVRRYWSCVVQVYDSADLRISFKIDQKYRIRNMTIADASFNKIIIGESDEPYLSIRADLGIYTHGII